MSAQLLLKTLRGLAETRSGLTKVLGAEAEKLFVYYACPLSNLRQIAKSGILPNATAPKSRTDLSGQSVQAKREVEVLLTTGKRLYVHQCINLFWNPLNWTLRAFQRNGVLRELSSKNPDDAVVCILEIDLERLLLSHGCRWTIAPQNLAGAGFASFSEEYFSGAAVWDDGTPRCDWKTILSVTPNTDRVVNRKRSAELIVHLGNGEDGISSITLPFELITRIIVPDEQVRALTADQVSFLESTNKVITRLSVVDGITIFFPKDELLRSEKGFVQSLTNRKKSDSMVLKKVNAALKAVERFELEHPELCPARERFATPELADDHHGSMHAARVMFWSAFLFEHFDEDTRRNLLPTVLVAASLHDTYRQQGGEDETHGRLAAEAHREIVARFLTDAGSVNSCLNAIEFHCVPDEKCRETDLTLQILKDADALDRGRFGAPDKPGGCDTKFLRTDVLKKDVYKNIAWLAYWAASITRYSTFGAKPCADFSTSLCIPVNSLSKK